MRPIALALVLALLTPGVPGSDAQVPPDPRPSDPSRPSDPPPQRRPPRQHRFPLPPEQLATICSNDVGWCPLPEGVVMAAGTPCRCFVPGHGNVNGVGRYFNYALYPGRPISPYFNPHWTDAPPVVR